MSKKEGIVKSIQKEERKVVKSLQKNHKTLLITIIILGIISLLFFGTKIALLSNFILGNDIIVKLKADKEELYLTRNKEETVTFEASVTTNPFCKAVCKSTFTDTSNNIEIERDNFTITPTSPLEKSYSITTNKIGEGKELYTFNMECHSTRTVLCHTDEQPTNRNILITVDYDLNEEDRQLIKSIKEQLESKVKELEEILGSYEELRNSLSILNNTLLISTDLKDNKKEIDKNIEKIKSLEGHWKKQGYLYIQSELKKLSFKEIKESFESINNELTAIIKPYNVLMDEISIIKEKLVLLQDYSLFNNSFVPDINNHTMNYNYALELFQQRTDLDNKKQLVESLITQTASLPSLKEEEIIQKIFEKQIKADLSYDILCNISGICIEHPSISKRASQTVFGVNQTCLYVEELTQKLISVNDSMNSSFINQSYPDSEEFWSNISIKINEVKQKIKQEHLLNLNSEHENAEMIKQIFLSTVMTSSSSGTYPDLNLTPALIKELIKQKPGECNVINQISEHTLKKIEFKKENQSVSLNIGYSEPLPQCCVLGKCKECCITEECEGNYTPIVFLHGHAFNKDVSAEYSLDAFNTMQNKLAEDGYLNAGAISLYTPRDTPYGIWKDLPARLTIKASYYYDIFKEPENYIVVQTKSENIDTYAIRLKELIETIQYKTGKQKIILITHSMGGLVARRYMQLFGDDEIEKAIFIAAPNKGIVGSIADYCTITGEKLECRDMNYDSLFMNKLNREELPDIPIYNIVGTGCQMKEGLGDGVVLEDKAMLEEVNNFIIEGTCQRLSFLHTEILDIYKHPELYDYIKKILEKKEKE